MMKNQVNMKGRLRRLRKTHEDAPKDDPTADDPSTKTDPTADKTATAKPPAEPKNILKEGWLKIHSESLLDE